MLCHVYMSPDVKAVPCDPLPQPVSYLGTAVVTGVLTMSVAWILFDFTDTPGGGERTALWGGQRSVRWLAGLG
jgi:hypothetical protein